MLFVRNVRLPYPWQRFRIHQTQEVYFVQVVLSFPSFRWNSLSSSESSLRWRTRGWNELTFFCYWISLSLSRFLFRASKRKQARNVHLGLLALFKSKSKLKYPASSVTNSEHFEMLQITRKILTKIFLSVFCDSVIQTQLKTEKLITTGDYFETMNGRQDQHGAGGSSPDSRAEMTFKLLGLPSSPIPLKLDARASSTPDRDNDGESESGSQEPTTTATIFILRNQQVSFWDLGEIIK